MLRLIDANKFYLYLNDFALAVSPNGWEDEDELKIREARYTTINNIMQALDEQPIVYDINKKWTIISEKLPDKNGFYLVALDAGDFGAYTAMSAYKDGFFYNKEEFPQKFTEEVIAWMPVPQFFVKKNMNGGHHDSRNDIK